jgi:Adenylate kinase and related kinases
MLNIIIFGAPGAGKGTQSKLIAEKYGLFHISTGTILREEIEKGTELGQIANQYITKGHFAPDDVVIKLLEDILNENPDEKGYLLDGFPRNLNQASLLDEMLKERNTSIAALINLAVDEEKLIKRLLKRGDYEGRADDNLEVVKLRLEIYKEKTEPLKEYYKKRGKLFNINGNGDVEGVFESILQTLDHVSF